MGEKANNFENSIHNAYFEDAYRSNITGSEAMVFDAGRKKESLSGWWSYGIDQYDTCLRARWFEEKYKDGDGNYNPIDFSFEDWEKMYVPSCWNTREEKLFLYEGSIVYTRTFKYFNHGEERVFLKLGAANYNARVFLNKQYLGMHEGGSTPFFFEITGTLQEVNRIIVVVNNTRKRTNVPGENTDWFNYGGLYRDVELIRLPATFIRDFYIRLVPDGQFNKIRADLSIDGADLNGTAFLKINELGIEQKINVINGTASISFEARPSLWSPDDPRLYDVTVEYGSDKVSDMVGFREIRTSGTDIILNGKKIFLKGICFHEESVPNGKAVTEEEIIENFSLAREMNCIFVRLAHYPHTEKAAKIADKMGILLWEEIPVYWAIEFDNPDTIRDAQNQLTELIKRDRNRASVIIWSVGNENADTDSRLRFMSTLAKKAKELDSSRLVSAACMLDHKNHVINDRLIEYVDVIGANQYYGWYLTNFDNLIRLFENSKPEKPVIITEFGADAKPHLRGTVDDKGTEDYQLQLYKKQVEVLDRIPYVKGITPWILYDFRCPRRLHFTQQYYNTKGLLSADKTYRKPAFYVMQEFYARK